MRNFSIPQPGDYCPSYGHIADPYAREPWICYLRGDKRTAMNLAIDRHSDLVAEKMDAFKAEMEPHAKLIKDEVAKAEARYREDVNKAEQRHARAMKALIKKIAPKDAKHIKLAGRHGWWDASQVLDLIWRKRIQPQMTKLRDFREGLLPPSRRSNFGPSKPKTQPTTPPEKKEAMSKKRVAKLVEGFTNTLEGETR